VEVRLEKNGSLTVKDLKNGRSLSGLNVFFDEGDSGDEYSFSPLPKEPAFSSANLSWKLSGDSMSLRAEAEFPLPKNINSDRVTRSKDLLPCSLATTIELDPGSPLVKVRTTFENRVSDHRLRACFPLDFQADESIAETAFGLVCRPVTPEPCEGWREATSENYVQRRFVLLENDERGFALFNKGLPEYAADSSTNLFLTLLRSVGWLSRDDLPLRPGQVGPVLTTPGAQCLGEHHFEYGILLFSGAHRNIPLFRVAEAFHHPLAGVACQTRGARLDLSPPSVKLPSANSLCAIDNPRVVLSAFTREGNALSIRVFNPYETPEAFKLESAFAFSEYERTTLDGKVLKQQKANVLADTVEPYTIATYRVRFI
jgi:alpha-mannosidase